MSENILNYQDWKNRKPNSIKKSVNGSLSRIDDGTPGSHVVVSAHIYDILKKRVELLERAIIEKAIEEVQG